MLFNQLRQASSIEVRQAVIARLGADYTHENRLHYNAVFAPNSANHTYHLVPPALPAFSAYLPSAGASNNTPNAQQKRPRDEEQTQNGNQVEQEEKWPDDESEAKKRKKR